MEKNNESRRDALKKLGLGAGAVYVAPAVTALVVPRHASATSVSGGGSGGSTPTSTSTTDTLTSNGLSIAEWKTAGTGATYILTIQSTGGIDLNGATVTIGGVSYGTLSNVPGASGFYGMNPSYDGSMVVGSAYEIVLGVSGNTYTKTATLVAA